MSWSDRERHARQPRRIADTQSRELDKVNVGRIHLDKLPTASKIESPVFRVRRAVSPDVSCGRQ
jgi:hypothetical protein